MSLAKYLVKKGKKLEEMGIKASSKAADFGE